MPSKRVMNDRPDRAHKPKTEGQRQWGRKNLNSHQPPPTPEELEVRKLRVGKSRPCRCWGLVRSDPFDPCSPRKPCDPACKACESRGPLLSWGDLRYLEGA